jgi:hypothetical protein
MLLSLGFSLLRNSGQLYQQDALSAISQECVLSAQKKNSHWIVEKLNTTTSIGKNEKTINTEYLLDASIGKVWKNISKATEVDTWLPIITTCQLLGQGEGAKRICGTEGGNLYETILKVDHSNKLFQYVIDEQPLLPLKNFVGTLKVSEQDNRTKLIWTADFEVETDEDVPMIEQTIIRMYLTGAKGLEEISK